MAATAGLRNQKQTVTPPLNGSFPIDREGKCKLEMLEYLLCLDEKKNVTEGCRSLAKTYLECRINNNLLERSDWEYLGFAEENNKAKDEKKE